MRDDAVSVPRDDGEWLSVPRVRGGEKDQENVKENKRESESKREGAGLSEPPMNPYWISAPFPQSLRVSKKPSHNDKIYKLFEQVKINIPLLNVVKQIPAYTNFLKDLCTMKRTLNLKDKALLMEQVSSII